jgi:site-specific DNA-adenine methylase
MTTTIDPYLVFIESFRKFINSIKYISHALRYSETIIFVSDYRDAIENAGKGDFVYLDQPYDPVSYTSNFTAYTSNGFGSEDQLHLANVSRKLSPILNLLENYILILVSRN